jgi:hypothetical protein
VIHALADVPSPEQGRPTKRLDNAGYVRPVGQEVTPCPGPEGIITGGHASKTGRTVAIRYGEAVTRHALIAMFWQVIVSD